MRVLPVGRSVQFTFRAIGDQSHHSVDDIYVVAQTSPVYVYCGHLSSEPLVGKEYDA
jgi:hypothetical protein